ncbi:hypothetical protein SynPROS71_01160 [Synechococcus sp. PROS-7-1]|nr:hypothetical protein SynPROS71_01160 [Synechococcus sp. PROS-7-1]
MGFKRERLEELLLRPGSLGLASRSTAAGETPSGLAGEQARRDAHPDQARCSYATCFVRSVELTLLVSTAWATR